MSEKDPTEWAIETNGGYNCKNRLYGPNSGELRKDILEEAYRSRLTVHPRGTKMQ